MVSDISCIFFWGLGLIAILNRWSNSRLWEWMHPYLWPPLYVVFEPLFFLWYRQLDLRYPEHMDRAVNKTLSDSRKRRAKKRKLLEDGDSMDVALDPVAEAKTDAAVRVLQLLQGCLATSIHKPHMQSGLTIAHAISAPAAEVRREVCQKSVFQANTKFALSSLISWQWVVVPLRMLRVVAVDVWWWLVLVMMLSSILGICMTDDGLVARAWSHALRSYPAICGLG